MFSDYFHPELGGIQDSIATVARSLGQRGHVVDIHVPRYGRRDYALVGADRAGEPELGANIRIHRHASLPFPSSTRQSRAALPSPLGWLRLCGSRRPDLIHVQSFFGLGLEGLFAAALLRLPVIGSNHTTVAGFAPHIPVSLEGATRFVMWFHNRCDHVTAPSRSVFTELGAARLHRPLTVISNPIDTALFAPAPDRRDALRARYGLTLPTIVFAGRLGAEKNVDILLRAMQVLDGQAVAADIVLAGHGAQAAALRQLAETLGIAARVRFLGTLAPADLAALFQAADLFVMPSTSETQSMALLQAMAAGLPVIAADSRALPEYVTPGNGRLVPPNDPAALAAALRPMLAEPALRAELGAGGRRSALAYGIETVCDQWESLYDAVLRRHVTE
jgi:glycosyltransferase involved in cell wall biosynthesis